VKIVITIFAFAAMSITSNAGDGFKGLHLRMTKEQVSELINATQWRVTNATDTNEWKLKPENLPDISFPSIAMRAGTRYDVDEVTITWHSNRITSVSLFSNKADSHTLRAWCESAIEGLTRRYGQPTEVIRTTDRIDEGTIMLNANPLMPLSGWETRTIVVIVAIIKAPREGYRASIYYSDNALSNASDKAKSSNDFNAL